MLPIAFKFLITTLNNHYFNNMEKQPKTLALPTFETVEQIMTDAYFLKCVDKTIAEMMAERDKVSEGGKLKLKRDAVSFLIDMNKFNSQSISTEYIEIHYKRSKLSGAIREFINFLVVECVGDTFKHYESLFQKQNKKSTKTKKS